MRTVVTITGPSTAGKSTLESKLNRLGFGSIVSTTTRAPRPGEVDGKNYHFVSEEDFQTMLNSGQFVEHVEFGGNKYAASVAAFEFVDNGMPIVIVVEPAGQEQIAAFAKKNGWKLVSVFLDCPPSVSAYRFVERTAKEVLTGDVDVEKCIASAAGRLATMMTTESEWSFVARATGRYSLVFERFNALNEESVISAILQETVG